MENLRESAAPGATLMNAETGGMSKLMSRNQVAKDLFLSILERLRDEGVFDSSEIYMQALKLFRNEAYDNLDAIIEGEPMAEGPDYGPAAEDDQLLMKLMDQQDSASKYIQDIGRDATQEDWDGLDSLKGLLNNRSEELGIKRTY